MLAHFGRSRGPLGSTSDPLGTHLVSTWGPLCTHLVSTWSQNGVEASIWSGNNCSKCNLRNPVSASPLGASFGSSWGSVGANPESTWITWCQLGALGDHLDNLVCTWSTGCPLGATRQFGRQIPVSKLSFRNRVRGCLPTLGALGTHLGPLGTHLAHTWCFLGFNVNVERLSGWKVCKCSQKTFQVESWKLPTQS